MRSLKTLLLAAVALAAIAVVATTAALASGSHQRHGGTRAHRLCGLDVYWLKSSIQGDVYEIRGGNMALDKSGNSAVRTLAQRLVSDHTQSLHDALELARKYHIDAEQKPTPTQHWQLEENGELSGDVFDHDFSQLEVLDHVQDIQDARSEVEMGCNREIRHDAAQEIPTLREHLRLARQALATTHED